MNGIKDVLNKFITIKRIGEQGKFVVLNTSISNLEKELIKQFSITAVSQQRELLKKWWEYCDKESVAVNCTEQEREEVINDFFNCDFTT
jgi:hypothetical protein